MGTASLSHSRSPGPLALRAPIRTPSTMTLSLRYRCCVTNVSVVILYIFTTVASVTISVSFLDEG